MRQRIVEETEKGGVRGGIDGTGGPGGGVEQGSMTIKLRILLCVLMLELSGYGLVLYLNYRSAQEGLATVREQQIGATFLGYLHKINALTNAMERNARDLAIAGERYHALRDVAGVAVVTSHIEQHLLRNFEGLSEALGGGLWFEPFAFDPGRRYFGPYAFREGPRIRFTWDLSQDSYDYLRQSWYLKALPADWPRTRRPDRWVVWTEPYYDDAGSKALMMTVDALMFDDAERIIGMATVDWSTEKMRQFVSDIRITPGSFPFLIDRQSGKFVSFGANPARVMTPAAAEPWAADVLAGYRTGELRSIRDVRWNGRPHRIYTIGTDIGLVLGLFIPEHEILQELQPGLRQNLIYGAIVSVSFILVMALALTVLFRPFQRVLAQISRSLRRDSGSLALSPLSYQARNEFTPIVNALNDVFMHISEFTASLAAANEALAAKQAEVNELNISLEHKVRERTEELAHKNQALEQSVEELRDTQQQLVEAEKHAALNQLVAGVAHEVNTPIGVAVTAASLLQDELTRILAMARSGRIDARALQRELATSCEAIDMTLANLQRAVGMVRTFKQISVDQSSEARRRFHVRAYIDDIFLSLRPRLKQSPVQVRVDCESDFEIDSYPGALSQIITNLVINALTHAFPGRRAGVITLAIEQHEGRCLIHFRDDGVGIAADHLPHIFEPFFTTRRGQGGSGLGLHIVYNLVSKTLGGRIRCDSELGKGCHFLVDIPLKVG
ncbi:ATP-binding protein [Tahibacter amnicola]|uniref:histidine kinase n=1 Tax=Tahibacter amnicola TaxID=2976241 RepID=A0ABY6BIQ6_9GAMM|nr:ATP-binding protein [Tahibacter amnicola]UXI69893.1 ATP-binding protein [Tahibacter amnicola]